MMAKLVSRVQRGLSYIAGERAWSAHLPFSLGEKVAAEG